MATRISQAEFLNLMQRYVAIDAVPASAMRNQAKGTVKAVHEYLGGVHLSKAASQSQLQYSGWLNNRTEALLDGLPGASRPWGVARKALNLFMRCCLYNHYLRDEFCLARVEPWLEIPLDSVIATALKRHAGWGALPEWPGLKRLTPEVSQRFQDHASEYAVELGLRARVFLDNYLWVRNR